ncbi:MAG TPA: four helix bundle protein [Thermoanaerobaculia bacterium]|nr:four helix bundle protein [Thermoanaerobaculia bacterium]
MSQSNYRDLVVWQKARIFAVEVYRVTQRFPRAEMFGLTQQMRRAAISVASNIAEGHGRRSSKDILHFLRIARGSLFEIETQLIIATDLAYIQPRHSETVTQQLLDVVRLLNGLIRHHQKLLSTANC